MSIKLWQNFLKRRDEVKLRMKAEKITKWLTAVSKGEYKGGLQAALKRNERYVRGHPSRNEKV